MDSPINQAASPNTLQRQMDLSSNQRLHRRQVSKTPLMEEAFFTPLASPKAANGPSSRFQGQSQNPFIQKPLGQPSVIPQPFNHRQPIDQPLNAPQFPVNSAKSSQASPHLNMPPANGSNKHPAPPNQQKPKTRKCAKCQQNIYGHFVKALQESYHINCFSCEDCGVLCAAKFFPVNGKPLCEHCYFKRQHLLCFRCGMSLRGSYVTALDRKYHVDHFTCSMCTTVFGPDDSYFEYQGEVYCRTHYGALFAFSCEGCQSPILKQYVETYRSSRQQQWHPECYMIYKFWNVKVTDPQTPKISALRKEISEHAQGNLPLDPRAQQVMDHEDMIDKNTMRIWSVLCAYEENCASHISQLVQKSVEGDSFEAHGVCTTLVDSVETLFLALDQLNIHESDDLEELQVSDKKRGTGREAKTLCRKIIGYMSLLSKTRKLEHDERVKSLASDLLMLTSSMAHYLKVLIRLGLSTALKKNLLDGFLVNLSEPKPNNQKQLSAISPFSSDRCCKCNKAVEDKCIRHKTKPDKLWHMDCFTDHDKPLDIHTAELNEQGDLTTRSEPAQDPEFVEISRLEQYISLLRVALARLNLVLSSQRKSRDRPRDGTADSLALPPNANSSEGAHPSRSSLELQSPPPKPTTASASNTPAPVPNANANGNAQSQESSTAALQINNYTLPLSSPAPKNSTIDLDAVHSAIIPVEIEANAGKSAVERTSSVLHGKNGLTLDDIRRIVAAEQARIPSAEARNAAVVIETRSKTPIDQTLNLNQQQTAHFGTLSTEEHQWVQYIALAMLQKYTDKQVSIDVPANSKQNTLWGRVNKVFTKESEGKVFGQPLDRLVSKYGIDSNYGCGDRFEGARYSLKIPSFVEDCVGSMRQKDMCVEGIFRKNGNIRRLREVVERIDKNPDDNAMLADESPIQLAALLKKFLRELPDPLLTSRLVDLWLKIPDFDAATQLEFMQLLVCLLPKNNRSVLEVLSYFLNWVSSFAFVDDDSGSKMDVSNLATVLAPSVMLNSEDPQAPQIDNSQYKPAIETFRFIINNYTMVALVPPNVTKCLNVVKSQPPRKLSLREVENYLK